MVRTRVDEVSVLSRNTQGVRLIKLKEGERMQGLERIEESADESAKRELANAEGGDLEPGDAEDLSADDTSVDDAGVDDASDE
jgi:DNA gyrase subunit A